MPDDGRDQTSLTTLADPAVSQRLADLEFDWWPVDRHACAALLFRRSTNDAPLVVGLIGGASAGKSTLFNTLVRSDASRISTVAHETVGPIAAVCKGDIGRVIHWIDGHTMFSGFTPASVAAGAPSNGRVESIVLIEHEHNELAGQIILDLPDVTTRKSSDEGELAHRLLPWFDVLVVVVDDERWFDATVFETTTARARAFGPNVYALFNSTDSDDPLSDDDRQRLAEHAAAHHIDGHAFSPYRAGTGYRPLSDDTRTHVLNWFGDFATRDRRTDALTTYTTRRCADAVRVNVERVRHFTELGEQVENVKKSSASEARLTFDLLTEDERGMLGVGNRWMPLYGVVRAVGRKMGRFGLRSNSIDVDFDKRTDGLAGLLRRNLEHRFRRVTDRIQRIVVDSAYWGDHAPDWQPVWELPAFDELEWARRIRAHIDAWKKEVASQSRKSDATVLSFGVPLLLADLLFLGGAGVSLMSAAAWAAGMVAGKGLVQTLQRSDAFNDYRATVDAYQAFVRETLDEQWTRNLANMPRRHLPIQDPVLQAMMSLAANSRASA